MLFGTTGKCQSKEILPPGGDRPHDFILSRQGWQQADLQPKPSCLPGGEGWLLRTCGMVKCSWMPCEIHHTRQVKSARSLSSPYSSCPLPACVSFPWECKISAPPCFLVFQLPFYSLSPFFKLLRCREEGIVGLVLLKSTMPAFFAAGNTLCQRERAMSLVNAQS